jgi:hypothetical protein
VDIYGRAEGRLPWLISGVTGRGGSPPDALLLARLLLVMFSRRGAGPPHVRDLEVTRLVMVPGRGTSPSDARCLAMIFERRDNVPSDARLSAHPSRAIYLRFRA